MHVDFAMYVYACTYVVYACTYLCILFMPESRCSLTWWMHRLGNGWGVLLDAGEGTWGGLVRMYGHMAAQQEVSAFLQ